MVPLRFHCYVMGWCYLLINKQNKMNNKKRIFEFSICLQQDKHYYCKYFSIMDGFICTFSLLISLSFTFQSSSGIISQSFQNILIWCVTWNERHLLVLSLLRYSKLTPELTSELTQSFELPHTGIFWKFWFGNSNMVIT